MDGLARSLSVECAIPLDSGLDNGARELDLFEKEMKDNRSRLGTELKKLEATTKKAGGKGGDQNTLIQAMKDYNAKREEIDQWKSNQLHTVFLIERRRFGEILSATSKVAAAQIEYSKVIAAMNDDTAGHTKLLGTLEALSGDQIEALSVASQKSYTALNTSEASNVTLTGSTNTVLARGPGGPSASPYGTPRSAAPSGPPSGAPPPPNFAPGPPGPPSGAPPPPNFSPGPPSGAPPPPNFSPGPPSYEPSSGGGLPPPMGLPKMPARGPPSMGNSPAGSPRPGGGPPPLPGGGPPSGSPGTMRAKGPPPPTPGAGASPRPSIPPPMMGGGGPPPMPGGGPPRGPPPSMGGGGPPPPMGGPPPPMMGGGGGPPPPPPGGAPPPPKAPKASSSSSKKKSSKASSNSGALGGGDPSEGRSDLLSSISGFKGGLKKTVTNDRSGPNLAAEKKGPGGGGRGPPPMF